MSLKLSPLKEKNTALPGTRAEVKTIKKNALIMVESRGGLGDLLFSIKTAQVLSKISEINCAILCNKDLDIEKITKIAGKALSIPIYAEENIPPSFAKNVDIYIGAATCTKREDLCFLQGFDININKPYLGFSEYNVYPRKKAYENPDDKEYVLGFGEKCLGIFLDEELIDFYRSKIYMNRTKRCEMLLELPLSLRDAILEKQTPEEYSKTSSFYMGYSYYLETAMQFLALVAEKESKDPFRTIDIVIPGKKRSSTGTQTLIHDFFKHPQLFPVEALKKFNISEVRCGAHVLKISDSDGKILKIHNPPLLEKEDFKTCLKASDPLMLVTGDQSLSEALSAGKVIMYEQLAHKEELLEDLSQVGAPFRVGKILHSLAFKECEDNHLRRFSPFLKLFEDPEYRSNYDKFITYLHENQRAEPKIEKIVKSVLKV